MVCQNMSITDVTAINEMTVESDMQFDHIPVPPNTPDPDKSKIYVKDDGSLYILGNDGIEQKVGDDTGDIADLETKTQNISLLTVPNETIHAGEFLSDNLKINQTLIGSQIATPANPVVGENKLYFKADDSLYTLDSAGNEIKAGGNPFDQNLNTTDNVEFLSTTTQNIKSAAPTNTDVMTISPTKANVDFPTELGISGNLYLDQKVAPVPSGVNRGTIYLDQADNLFKTKTTTDTNARFVSSDQQTDTNSNVEFVDINVTGDIENLSTIDTGIALGLGSDKGLNSVSIGLNTGTNVPSADAISIGKDSGVNNTGLGSVQIGVNAGETASGTNSVSIGNNAGNLNAGTDSIQIGTNAGDTNTGERSICIGKGVSADGINDSITISANPVPLNSFGTNNILLQAGITSLWADNTAFRYNGDNLATQNFVQAGYLPLAGGSMTGDISNLRTNDNNIILGNFASSGASECVSIGSSAGGSGQGINCLAIGDRAGNTNQGNFSTAIGATAGLSNQGTFSVAIGANAGVTAQGSQSVAIGNNAGLTNQPDNSIAIAGSGLPINLTSIGDIILETNNGGTLCKLSATRSPDTITAQGGTTTSIDLDGVANEMILQAGTTSFTYDATGFDIPNTTESTTTTTGALQVAGGAGIAKNLNVGGDIKITGGLTFPKPWGECYAENNASPTTCTAAFNFADKINTMYKVVCTTTLNPNSQSMANGNNRLTYTGTMTKTFHSGVTFSLKPGNNTNQEFYLGVVKNGTTVLPGSIVTITTTNSTRNVSSAIHIFAELATNDYMELWVGCSNALTDCTVTQINMFGMATPNEV